MRLSVLNHMILILTGVLSVNSQTVLAKDPLVFITSFGPGDQGAIQSFRLDTNAGTIKLAHRNSGVENPFFIAISPDQKHLYSINAKQFGGKDPEEIAAFEITDETGVLKMLNKQSAKGTAACFLEVDGTGKSVLVANYSSGSVAALPIEANGVLAPAASFFQHTGLSIDPSRQSASHAHCIVMSPDNRFAFAADLGLDQVLSYKLDPATATLTPSHQPFVRTPAGAGPRHLTFHPNKKQMYVINELGNSVTLFDFESQSGFLIERQTISTVPADFKEKSYCADLKITPDGKFLYGTNRGHDSIAAYSIGDAGQLTLIGIFPSLGKGPQNLAVTANGSLLLCANMPGNNLAIFRINPDDGKLTAVGDPITMHSPSCIRILK